MSKSFLHSHATVAGRPIGILLIAGVAAACGSSTPTAVVAPEGDSEGHEQAQAPLGDPPLGQLPETVTPTHYELSLTVVPSEETFQGEVAIAAQVSEPTDVIWIHGESLQVSEASVVPDGGDAVQATWSEVGSDGVSALRLASPVGPGDVTIRVTYAAAFDRQLEGLYRVDEGGESYAFTQMEAISARKAFPSFDEPRFKTPYAITLTVKEEHVAAANAPVAEEEVLPSGMRVVRFDESRPLPTYLVALAVGPFDVVEGQMPANEHRSEPLSFRGLAVRGKGEQLAYALEETPKILSWLEGYFGMAYPYQKLDIVAVPDFSAGAMENVGLVTFREWLLLVDPETAPENQKRAFAYVMAHELAHMWFGNLVTLPWWDDLWLNEAFATWMGNKTVRGVYPGYEADVSHVESAQRAMRSDSLSTARQIRQPIESNHDISNAFDSITYSKGGAVLEMFEQWMGEESFKEALRAHMGEHAHQNANADDLLSSLQGQSEKPVAAPFRTFLFQSGVPMIEAEVECGDDGARLNLSQQRFLPAGSPADAERTWTVPVCAKFGVGRQTQTACVLLEEQTGSLALGDRCPAWVLPNADAAGYYRFSLAPEDLDKLKTAGWRSLNTRERLAVADSLRASFESASTPAADILSALEAVAASDEHQVASAPMRILGYVHDYVLESEEERASLREYANRLYERRFRRVGWGPRGGRAEDAATRLFRADLLRFLGDVARNERIRSEAAERAQEYLGYGGDGEIHPDALDANLVGSALRFAVQDGDAELFDAALARFVASSDATVRRHLLSAISAVRDPELAARARALALDERLRTNEVMSPLRGQMSMEETRPAAWAWLKEHFDDLGERASEGRLGGSPWLASNFCSEERATEVQSFFGERIRDLDGGPRNLAGAVEAIRLCSARAQAHRTSAVAFFE